MIEGLEALKRIKTSFNSNCLWAQESCNIIDKELKALEILKRGNFQFGDKYKFRITLNSGIILTKEEFELLKEVLL